MTPSVCLVTGTGYDAKCMPVRGYDAKCTPVTGCDDKCMPVRGYDKCMPVRGYDDKCTLVTGYDAKCMPVTGCDAKCMPVTGCDVAVSMVMLQAVSAMPVAVSRSRTSTPGDASLSRTNIYIRGLASSTTDQDLMDLCSE